MAHGGLTKALNLKVQRLAEVWPDGKTSHQARIPGAKRRQNPRFQGSLTPCFSRIQRVRCCGVLCGVFEILIRLRAFLQP